MDAMVPHAVKCVGAQWPLRHLEIHAITSAVTQAIRPHMRTIGKQLEILSLEFQNGTGANAFAPMLAAAMGVTDLSLKFKFGCLALGDVKDLLDGARGMAMMETFEFEAHVVSRPVVQTFAEVVQGLRHLKCIWFVLSETTCDRIRYLTCCAATKPQLQALTMLLTGDERQNVCQFRQEGDLMIV